MIEAVVKEISVRATADEAFRRFTEEIDGWWPKSTHSVSQGKCRSISWAGLVGAQLYEVDEHGTRHVWGTFTAWDPPGRFGMTWHPGRSQESPQEVELTFEADGDETIVRLGHSNFEGLGASAQETRERYEGGWQSVLQLYDASL